MIGGIAAARNALLAKQGWDVAADGKEVSWNISSYNFMQLHA
jgi:hypothetical protein